MNKKDGTALETLVAEIEGHLCPSGFQVETREPVVDEAGKRIAEFDVVIRGPVGTSGLSWLIECRDRPSKGPAPPDWIQQLDGRRRQFRFDEVMAVSSTGFSPSAVIAAENLGIELRHLRSLDYESVARWLPLNAPVIVHKGTISGGRVIGLTHDPAQEGELSFNNDNRVFVAKSSGERHSIMELWQQVPKLDS